MPPKEDVFKAEYSGPAVNDCSGYFKKVLSKLRGVPMPPHPGGMPADALIDYISGRWLRIGQGSVDGPLAASFASQGYFVVALLKARDHVQFKKNKVTGKYDVPYPRHHGHMAIVMSKSTTDFPYVICGSNDPTGYGKSDGTKKVYEAGKGSPWRDIDAPKVEYFRTPSVIADPAD